MQHVLPELFTLDRLLDTNDQEAWLQLNEAMQATQPIPRALRLIFVFDGDIWRESVLERLHEEFDSGALHLADDFKCYLLTQQGLKAVIAGSYAEANRIFSNGH